MKQSSHIKTAFWPLHSKVILGLFSVWDSLPSQEDLSDTPIPWELKLWWTTCVGLNRLTEPPSLPANFSSTWPRATRSFSTRILTKPTYCSRHNNGRMLL